MRKVILAVLLLALIAPAFAMGVEFERGTVSTGDTVKKMLRIAGKPNAILQPRERSGFQVYEYLTTDKNIRFTVKDGKIVGIGVGRR